jgi:hypothetical protein
LGDSRLGCLFHLAIGIPLLYGCFRGSPYGFIDGTRGHKPGILDLATGSRVEKTMVISGSGAPAELFGMGNFGLDYVKNSWVALWQGSGGQAVEVRTILCGLHAALFWNSVAG